MPAPIFAQAVVDGFALIVRWVGHLRAQGFSPDTIRLYSYGVFRLMTDLQLASFADVTEEHVDQFLAAMSDRAAAKALYVRGVRSLFGFATRRGHIPRDPTYDVRVKRPVPRRPKAALRDDELARLLYAAAVQSPRRAWTLMLAYSLGCRRSELAGIRPADVDEDRIYLRHTKGDRPRWIEQTALSRAALEGLRPWWAEASVLGGVVPQTVTEWAVEAARAAGLGARVAGRPSHILRASFITHMLNAGVPVHVVRDLAGHRNIATTNEYAVVFDEDRRGAIDRVIGRLAG